jgi:CxxC-x17-CxxC domain-containing protein
LDKFIREQGSSEVAQEAKLSGINFVLANKNSRSENAMEGREMHKAVCADCGQECEVPFKPDGTRPVYCRECFAKRRPQRSDFGRRSYGSNRSYRRY